MTAETRTRTSIEFDKCVFVEEMVSRAPAMIVRMSYMRVRVTDGPETTLLTCLPLTPNEQRELDRTMKKEFGVPPGAGGVSNLRTSNWSDGVNDAIAVVKERLNAARASIDEPATFAALDDMRLELESMLERGEREGPLR